MKNVTVLAAAVVLAMSASCGVNKATHQKALDQISALEGELDATKKDKSQLQGRIDALEGNLTDAQREKAATEREKERRILALMTEMKAGEKELLALRAQRARDEKRLSAYRALNDKLRQLVDTGKLRVSFRNGQMVLELPSEVLFPSGRAELQKGGEESLAEVLAILKEFKDRRFLIAGHTDNVPIRSRRFRNNWYLSTARAISVLEFMIENGFAEANLGAAGYGEFAPVAPNDTAENRALNRRIEIILVPDLSELPNLAVEPDDAGADKGEADKGEGGE